MHWTFNFLYDSSSEWCLPFHSTDTPFLTQATLSMSLCLSWVPYFSLRFSVSLYWALSLTHTHTFNIQMHRLSIFVICHSSSTFVKVLFPRNQILREKEQCRAITGGSREKVAGLGVSQRSCVMSAMWPLALVFSPIKLESKLRLYLQSFLILKS